MNIKNINKAFRRMIQSGETDQSIQKDLNLSMANLNKEKRIILKRKDYDLVSKFSIFHAIETEIRFLGALIKRLKDSIQLKDNPTIAEDALAVIPEFENLHLSLKILEKNKSNIPLLLELAIKLESKAIKHNIYPPRAELIKDINRTQLKKDLSSFAQKMGDIIETI